MDVNTWVNILLWIHIIALAMGAGSSVAMPVIGSKMAGATPEMRATLFSIGNTLSMIGRTGMVILLITGPLMFWLRWNWTAPSMIWFGIKMALMLVMLIGIVISGINFKKAQGGDMAAAGVAAMAGRITGLAFLGVVLAAVFAFN